MRFPVLFLMLLAWATEAAPNPFSRQDRLALRGAMPSHTSVPRYGLFELTLDFAGKWENPFDPEQAEVWAEFTSPDARTRRVNGFLDQPFTRRLDQGREKIEPAGQPVWRIRFTPETVGEWRYRVFARDRNGATNLAEQSFQAIASTNAGFIRRSGRSPRMFAFDDGRPFFAIGENVCWGGQRGSFDYDDWLPALSQAGGNWIRIWMSSWNCGLEWSEQSRGDWRNGSYHGAGVYSLDNAWKLDTILDLAAAQGLYVMLCFGTYGEFNEGGYFNEGQWKANPYNVTNGGPCVKAAEFWTSPAARKLYRQRLRYLAARYGWRTGIHSWEFWNEANPPAVWVAEMARCMKGRGEFGGYPLDPFAHLVTTTYGSKAIWEIPELDFTQSHHYGVGDVPDHAPVIHGDAQAHLAYGKPHLMGEFGIDWRDADRKYDPDGQGLNLHNGLWASAMSGNAGGGMLWWWDNYVHPRKLYSHFKPLRQFADSVLWTRGVWKPLVIEQPRETVVPKETEGLVLPAKAGWGRIAQLEFSITSNEGTGAAKLPQFLYSPGKPREHTRPTFKFSFDRSGRFAVKVNSVSASATLRFTLDGRTVKELSLSASPPTDAAVKPEYETTELNKQWQVYQARFNKEYGIEVPAGQHSVQLEVTEGDWLSVTQYTLTGYRTLNRALPLNLYGMASGTTAIFWAQNANSNWKSTYEKTPVHPVRASDITASGLPYGDYVVEWWDTWKGAIIRQEPLTVGRTAFTLHLPELATDVAARIFPPK